MQLARELKCRSSRSNWWISAFVLLLVSAASLAMSSAARAGAPSMLWQVPATGPASGEGADELHVPLGIGVDPNTGNVFVADAGNNRVSEFSPLGGFVRAWGWGVLDGSPELQVCTAESGCRIGIAGTEPGQFTEPSGVAVDAAGDVYILDSENRRVEKFDPEGHFLLAWGEAGTGPGQFSEAANGPVIAVSPAGLVYVGDQNRIQIFDSSGTYQGQVGLPREGEVAGGAPEGKGPPGSLAFDPAGDLYFDFRPPVGEKYLEGIFKYDGTTWSRFAQVFSPGALAVGAGGDVYVAGRSREEGENSEPHIFVFAPDGSQQVPTHEEEEQRALARKKGRSGEGLPPLFGEARLGQDSQLSGLAASGMACRAAGEDGEDLYASYYGRTSDMSSLQAYGPPPNPAVCFSEAAPSITDQFATAVESEAATVEANINPHSSPTTYFVQWGTGRCSEGACTSLQPLPPGAPLGSESSSVVTTAGVTLLGLAPETTYHYRFVARTRLEGSGEEVEVVGVGGVPGTDGAEASFTTPPLPLSPRINCPNQAFRVGRSARLSDCRAYEMVSPVDKAGGDIRVLPTITNFPAGLDQSSLSGDRMTYSSYRPFGDAQAAPFTVQYLATRGGTGWTSEAISPPRGMPLTATAHLAESEYKLFGADLCQSWLRVPYELEQVLDPDAMEGFTNLYRRDGCGATASYEALTTVVPTNHRREALLPDYLPDLQGASIDGRCAIFVAEDQLTPDAPELSFPEGDGILYEHCAGQPLRLVAILPNGSPLQKPSNAGSASLHSQSTFGGVIDTVYRALSTDGNRVFWSEDEHNAVEGSVYLRLNSGAAPTASGACEGAEPDNACTVAVSAGPNARFWTASPDGSRALYSEEGKLYEFRLRIEAGLPKVDRILIAPGFEGVLGASGDARRVYFASSKALALGAHEGEPNLYFQEGGRPPVLIGTLSPEDLQISNPNVNLLAITAEPAYRAARVSPDGLHAAFLSHAPLTGFDNTDRVSREADAEVFVYDATTGKLACVSCNPGVRPRGRQAGGDKGHNPVWAAAQISGWESDLQEPRNLSEDGGRLLFDSFEPLLPSDRNDQADVYEWQSASGKADCESAGAERYVGAAGGCLSLISGGTGKSDSEFVEAGPAGRDVFFATGAGLLPQDPGQIDIYDAREGGGFAVPAQPVPCSGEACQAGQAPPAIPTPASGARGAENPRNPRPYCGKGRHAVKKHGKWRCVKKRHRRRHAAHHHHGAHHHHLRKHHKHDGGAGR